MWRKRVREKREGHLEESKKDLGKYRDLGEIERETWRKRETCGN